MSANSTLTSFTSGTPSGDALRVGGGEDAVRHLRREEAAEALALLLLGHDLLVEARALDRHRRVVGERGQQVEVVQA